VREIKELVKGECCNWVASRCIGKDSQPCCIIAQQKLCKFFAKYVLPLQPELEDKYYIFYNY
jgi:hypothetical protein